MRDHEAHACRLGTGRARRPRRLWRSSPRPWRHQRLSARPPAEALDAGELLVAAPLLGGAAHPITSLPRPCRINGDDAMIRIQKQRVVAKKCDASSKLENGGSKK